jgi:hypothetical protein
MRGNASIWHKCFALLILFSLSPQSKLFAQTGSVTQPTLHELLNPGMTVWITDSNGQERKTRIISVADDIVTTTGDGTVRRLQTADISRIRAPHFDSVLNGALIGAGAAVASGLLFCRSMEPWENCRDDVGAMFLIGATGAGIGIGIDALFRGRQTIYEAPKASARVRAVPMIGRRAAGFNLSFSF